MDDLWFKKTVIYCLDVETFQDSDGDGIGDLPGLIARLDYLVRLGVTCIWLHPIHPSPNPGTVVALTNLRDKACTVDLTPDLGTPDVVLEGFGDRRYETDTVELSSVELEGWGYRWLRVA